MKATWMYLLAVIAAVIAILVLALCLIAGTHNPQAWSFALFGALVGGGSVHLCHRLASR